MTAATYSDFQLPWQAGEEENKRFRRFLINGLIAFAVISIAASWLPVIEQTVNEQQAEQLELTRVILEPQIIPEPEIIPVPEPEVIPVPEVIPEPEVVPVPVVEVISEPEPVPVQAPPIVEPEPELIPEPEPVVDVVQQAREQAQVAGVMAFQDDLQAMRDAMSVSSVSTSDLTRSNAEAEQVERNIITAGALVASGGIETTNLSRDSGGVALSGHQNTVIDVPQGAVSGSGAAPGVTQNYSGRSDEEVRRVMDSNKSVIYALYNRALRQDPTLKGRFMFEMVIDPDGRISSVKTLSSELNDTVLEDKLLARIALISFPAADVSVTQVNYSFDFIPY